MNDDSQTIEQELAQLTPARLSFQQRARLRNQIAARLAQPTPAQVIRRAFHWESWLAWGGAATAVLLIGLAMGQWSPNFKKVATEEVAFSNAWAVQVVSLIESPVCSNVRLNQSFQSISFSNLPQMILPARGGHKI